MLFAVSSLKGCEIAASDGRIGTVKDVLFDDQTWRVRWMVVDTGQWLPGRKVLIHPSAIAPLEIPEPSETRLKLMRFGDVMTLSVRLTRAQIEQGPEISEHEPVSAQMEHRVYDYYGWAPVWGATFFGTNAIASAVAPPPLLSTEAPREADDTETHPADGDPHLRSVDEIIGYHILASDGEIGHVQDFLGDDADWGIRYLIVDTRNWWPGRHVLLAPFAVLDIDWSARHVSLNVTRDQVKSSPPWDSAAAVDRITEQQLHTHYGWPGYGG